MTIGIRKILLLCLFYVVVCPAPSGYGQNVAIPQKLMESLYRDMQSDSFHLSEADKQIIVSHFQSRLEDINEDSVPEVILTVDHPDWCGAGGNCTNWIYQEANGDYKLILEDSNLEVTNTFTNGFRDIISKMPIGFCSKNEWRFHATTYKYDGKAYKEHSTEWLCVNRKTKKSRIWQEQ